MSFNHPSSLPYTPSKLNAPGHLYITHWYCEFCDFTEDVHHQGPDGERKEWLRLRLCPNCKKWGCKTLLSRRHK